MLKKRLLVIVNILLFFSALSVMTSGIFRPFIPYEIFGTYHPLGGYVLSGLVVCHVILNFNWIIGLFRKK